MDKKERETYEENSICTKTWTDNVQFAKKDSRVV